MRERKGIGMKNKNSKTSRNKQKSKNITTSQSSSSLKETIWPDCVILYKFMSLEAFESTCETWSLKACIPYEANDILELTPQSSTEGSKEFHSRNQPQYSPPPFLCFSRKITNPVMWGHYADSGRGVCLVFCFPIKIGEWNYKELASRDLYFDTNYARDKDKNHINAAFLSPVKYQQERVSSPKGIANADLKAVQTWFQQLITTKGEDWKYEEEIRMISDYMYSTIKKGKVFFSWPMNYLLGVVSGPKCKYSPEIIRGMLKSAYKEKGNKENYYLSNFGTIFPTFITTAANFHWKNFEIEAAPWGDRLYGQKVLVAYAAYLSTVNKQPLPTLDVSNNSTYKENFQGSWNDNFPKFFESNDNDVLIFSTIREIVLREKDFFNNMGFNY